MKGLISFLWHGYYMYNYLRNHIRVLRLRTLICWHNGNYIPGNGVAISRHWVRGLKPRAQGSRVILQTETGPPQGDTDSDAWPANVALTADRCTKIHIYIRKSFKFLLMIFLPSIQQCLLAVSMRQSNDIWWLVWLHVSQATIRKEIYCI